MMLSLILTAATVALSESTTHIDSGGGDGWVISQGYAMHVPSAFLPETAKLLGNES